MHIVIAVNQQRFAQRCEDARLIATEIIGKDQIQGFAGLGLLIVVPLRAVP